MTLTVARQARTAIDSTAIDTAGSKAGLRVEVIKATLDAPVVGYKREGDTVYVVIDDRRWHEAEAVRAAFELAVSDPIPGPAPAPPD